MIEFEIQGVAEPKGRPRFSRHGRSVHTYTPDKTKQFERWFQHKSDPYKPAVPLELPVALDVRFYLPAPKRIKVKDEDFLEHVPVVVKPDLDNLLKGVMDAMNKIFWKDDNQVYRFTSEKFYSSRPRICVRVTTRSFYPQNINI